MKRNEIFVGNLCLEVTRRCNMGCAHCLRGNAEDLDMSHETIEQVLGQVDVIGQVTFTGGEPSLNVDAIRYFFAQARKYGKLPRSFFVATNGKANQEELAIELLKQYPDMEEQEFCGVALSVDEWHDPQDYDRSILKIHPPHSRDFSRELGGWTLLRLRKLFYALMTQKYYPQKYRLETCSILTV